MSEQSPSLESMSCEELLKELARLTSEHDHLQAHIATPDQAIPEQAPQVDALLRQSDRMQRIGELLKARGCR